MERMYGKGLVGMYDEQGRMKMDRFGNVHHIGKQLSSSISTTIAPGVTIDATGLALPKA